MRHTIARLGLISLLTISAAGCAAQEDDTAAEASAISEETASIPISRAPEHSMLSGVGAIDDVDTQDAASLRLYTLDTNVAMNGRRLFLGAFGENLIDGKVYDLALDVAEVTKLETTAPGTLHIVGFVDATNAEGEVVSGQPFEATVRYRAGADGAPASSVQVESAGETHTVAASTDAGEAFLARVWSARSIENDDFVKASVFEGGHPDAASNGVNAFLSLQTEAGAATYDLGLNVAGITKLTFTGPSSLRIEAVEDTFVDGEVQPGNPVAFEVSFSLTRSGTFVAPVRLTTSRPAAP